MKAFLALSLVLAVTAAFGAERNYETLSPEVLKKLDFSSDAGNPVYLTKYLNDPATGQARSRVVLPVKDPLPNPTYAGYITVNETTDSNMFYWFFPAQNGNADAPVVLWLQGGPGASSLFGLFVENGPYEVNAQLELEARNITWNSQFHMLYIDNPVGTGFSYSDPEGVCTDEDCVARNLYECLSQFFTVFDQYADNDFYISGESYAGKYVPSIMYYALGQSQLGPLPFNLVGFSVGDGLVDPIHQAMAYADMAFNVGIGDELERQTIIGLYNDFATYVAEENWLAASNALVNDAFEYYMNISGSTDPEDIRQSHAPVLGVDYSLFVNQSSVRAALNVGNHYYQSGVIAYEGLQADQAKSVAFKLPSIMMAYKSLFYNGQYDWIVAPPTTELMFQQLQWPLANEYAAAKKTIWSVHKDANQVAGYVRSVGNFTQIVVRNAGHLAPYNQPESCLDMMERFIYDKPWTN